tara:strand:- start:509 stop:916 length:408 start_codon:yes stop_codon:yes gene_type:complete
MSNKPLKISESAAVQMPMKTVASLIVMVAMGVFAYTEITGRLTSLETQTKLTSKDLEAANEFIIGVPKGKMVSPQIQELFMLVEDLYKSVEKIEVRIEDMMHNKVNIEFLQKQTEKLLEDVEKLKDKVRANGSTH